MSDLKVVTGEVRFSFAHLFTPTSVEVGGDLKYSVTALIDKTSKEGKDTIKRIEAAIEAAEELGKTKYAKWKGKLPKGYESPLFDGARMDDREEYEDTMYIKAQSKDKPGIVDENVEDIIDQSEIYSGAYGRISMTFFPYDKGTMGVGCALNNVQKLKDGESLGGAKAKASEDFTKVKGAGSAAKDKKAVTPPEFNDDDDDDIY